MADTALPKIPDPKYMTASLQAPHKRSRSLMMNLKAISKISILKSMLPNNDYKLTIEKSKKSVNERFQHE